MWFPQKSEGRLYINPIVLLPSVSVSEFPALRMTLTYPSLIIEQVKNCQKKLENNFTCQCSIYNANITEVCIFTLNYHKNKNTNFMIRKVDTEVDVFQACQIWKKYSSQIL